MSANGVTPALCAFADGLPFRAVEEHADTLRMFLKEESVLYQAVFLGFAYSRKINSGNKRTMRDFFCAHLQNESIVKGPAHLIPELGAPVHDEYWQLAEDERFWPGDRPNGSDDLRPFNELLVVWTEQRQRRLADLAKYIERVQGVLRA
jgi:hypothetical protein